MEVMMGNATPHQCDTSGGGHAHVLLDHGEPCTYNWGDFGALTHDSDAGLDGLASGVHVLSNDVTHLPESECFVSIVSDWPHHSPNPPAWVWASDPDLARMLSEFYGCPVGVPEDLEDTHHTAAGPPGVGPTPAPLELVPDSEV